MDFGLVWSERVRVPDLGQCGRQAGSTTGQLHTTRHDNGPWMRCFGHTVSEYRSGKSNPDDWIQTVPMGFCVGSDFSLLHFGLVPVSFQRFNGPGQVQRSRRRNTSSMDASPLFRLLRTGSMAD